MTFFVQGLVFGHIREFRCLCSDYKALFPDEDEQMGNAGLTYLLF